MNDTRRVGGLKRDPRGVGVAFGGLTNYGATQGQLGTMKEGMMAIVSPTMHDASPVTHTIWTGLYKDGWKGLIVADEAHNPAQLDFMGEEKYSAFSHPAKVSRGLCRRIYEHLRDAYGLQPGAQILDPFCGIGGFALDAYLLGYHFVGVELEEKFHVLSLKNQEYWRHKFGAQPGTVTLLQGDSRNIQSILKSMVEWCECDDN